jgi:hypothetical protein
MNISLYDEKTQQLFDMDKPSNVQLNAYCGNNEVQSFNLTAANSWLLNITCTFNRLRATVEYPSDQYYRTLTYTSSVNFTNIKVWLIELTTTTALLNNFQSYDLLRDYQNARIVVTKIIGTNEELITGDYIDSEAKITAYLIKGDEYLIKVQSDNQPDRIFGTYFADTEGTKVVRLFDLDLVSEATSFGSQVSYYTYMLNESGDLKIRSAYNDTGSNVQLAQFEVYQDGKDGVLLMNATSTSSSAFFTYDVDDSTPASQEYYAELTLYSYNGIAVPFERQFRVSENVDVPTVFANANTLKWILFFVMLVFALSLTISTESVGALLLVGLAALLTAMGWLRVGETTGMATAVLGLAAFVALVNLLKKGSDGDD